MQNELKHRNLTTVKFNIIKSTLIFSIVGIFIPGFTAIGLLGFQMLLSGVGIECSNAWIIIWTLTSLLGVIFPVLFYRHISNLTEEKSQSLKIKLILFNLSEYIFIQSSLTPLFTNGKTLCYVTDGQNGIELVFTAWLALPVLILISVFFNQKNKNKLIKH